MLLNRIAQAVQLDKEKRKKKPLLHDLFVVSHLGASAIKFFQNASLKNFH
ncbi:hypothetical protein [Macrococcoides caseolyticum]|nr:hypothetical protein [Macrococcus caseolyticus]